MLLVILGMLVCIALALFVVAAVAVPAQRDGESFWTAEGEATVNQIVDRTGTAVSAVRSATGEAVSVVRDKVGSSAR